MNKKYVIAAFAAGATIAGCGWYFFKASQRKAAEMQARLQGALLLAKDGDFDQSTQELQACVQEMQEFYGPNDPVTMHAVSILAGVLHRQNRLPEAEQLMRACAVGLDQALGADHDESLGCHTELLRILSDAGKASEALEHGNQLFERLCKKLGPNHLQSVNVGVTVCTLMKQEGRLQDSEDLAHLLVDSCRSGSPSAPSTPEPLYAALRALAEILRDSGNLDEAIQCVLPLPPLHVCDIPPLSPLHFCNILRMCAHELVAVSTANSLEADGTPQSHYLLLNLLMSSSRIDDALLTARCIVNYCEQQHGLLSQDHVQSQLVLARLLHQSGAFEEAVSVWGRASVVLTQNLGEEHPEILDLQVHDLVASALAAHCTHTRLVLPHTRSHTPQVQMATCLLQMDRHAEAEPMLQRVVDMHAALPDGKLSTTYLMAAHFLSMSVAAAAPFTRRQRCSPLALCALF